MSSFYTSNNDHIFTENLAIVQDNLKGKSLIYSVQYITNEDTQIDGDGPQSSWCVEFFSIEKIENDFIFHIFSSNYVHAYSYPYLCNINKSNHHFVSLSDLKNELKTIFNKSLYDISNFIRRYEESYSHAHNSKDDDLTKEMKEIALNIYELEKIRDEKRDEQQKAYQEMLASDEYKAKCKAQEEKSAEYKKTEAKKYQDAEQERLKRCIEAYGEEAGYRFWQRL
jgi:hypothetical protein